MNFGRQERPETGQKKKKPPSLTCTFSFDPAQENPMVSELLISCLGISATPVTLLSVSKFLVTLFVY